MSKVAVGDREGKKGMSHRFTDPADERRQEPEQDLVSSEWDEEEPGPELRVLWGRLAVLGLLLAIAFILGRTTAPGGVPEAQLTGTQAELREAQETIDRLEAEAAEEPEPTPTPTATPEAAEEGDVAEDPAAEAGDVEEPLEGETYIVESGDSLQYLADLFYDDPTLADVIAEANDIEDPSLIAPGTELIIPEDPEP